ncbi:MAG: hypothetical protein ACOZBL_00740 [Patescibacteria group bacterium]
MLFTISGRFGCCSVRSLASPRSDNNIPIFFSSVLLLKVFSAPAMSLHPAGIMLVFISFI